MRGRLEGFAAEVFAPLVRRDQRAKGALYLRGLLLDGRRKSMQPMAERLGVDHQQLQQFITTSTWQVRDVRARLAWRAVAVVQPQVWVVDDTGFPKEGRSSAGVARQYSGTLGKVGNCQIGVSVHAASEEASCPLSWRLFLPAAWDGPDAQARRRACRIPDDERHRPKWQLALDMLDELMRLRAAARRPGRRYRLRRERRLPPRPGRTRPGLGAAGQGRDDRPRPGRGAAPARVRRARPQAAAPLPHPARVIARAHTGRRSRPRSDRDLAQGIEGGDELALRFLRVRLAGRRPKPAADGTIGLSWLIARWPEGEREPVQYWISNLPPDIPARDLVRLAKARWRIEHDYRELKTALGLDHFEGRSFMRLAPARHPRHRRPPVPDRTAETPKSPCQGLTLYQALDLLQQLIATWTGTCPICRQTVPWQPYDTT